VVKDIFCQTSGVVEKENDILRELVIKPGELLKDLNDPEAVMNRDGTFGQPGEEISLTYALNWVLHRVRISGRTCFITQTQLSLPYQIKPSAPSTQSSTGMGRLNCGQSSANVL